MQQGSHRCILGGGHMTDRGMVRSCRHCCERPPHRTNVITGKLPNHEGFQGVADP
jgi:hypothetical protein